MKKTIALFLSLLLAALCLASCGGGETSEPESSAAAGSTAPSESSDDVSEEVSGFPLEKKTYDTELVILVRSNHTFGSLQFVPAGEDETTFDRIDAEVKARNDTIETEYGISISTVKDSSPGVTIREKILTGDDTYDLVCDSANNMLPGVQEQCFWSLDDALSLDQPWYDQNAISNLSIADRTFFVAGDMLLTDDDYTYLCLYNKDMYKETPSLEQKYGSLNQLVEDGKWTYDLFYQMCKEVSQPDENGQWGNENGIYGNISEGYVTAIWVNGAGVRTVEKGADGTLTLNVASERSQSAFAKVFDIMSDQTNTIRVEQFPSEGWSKTMNMFINGKGLFFGTTVASITTIRNSDSEDKVRFGVLPVPKLNEEQTDYYNGINSYQSSVIGIPVSNKENFDAACYLIELLGYYSDKVVQAYYEVTLKTQAIVDEEDSEMLDYIFSHRLYDLGALFNWGGNLIGVYSSVMRSGSNTLVSTFEGMREAAQTAMDETVEAYSKVFK